MYDRFHASTATTSFQSLFHGGLGTTRLRADEARLLRMGSLAVDRAVDGALADGAKAPDTEAEDDEDENESNNDEAETADADMAAVDAVDAANDGLI